MVGEILMVGAMTFPNWSEFTPEKAAADLPRQLEAAEKRVAEIERSNPTNFEGLVWALNDATRELNLTWGMLSHMTSVMNSDAWRKVEEEMQPKMVEFGLRMAQSKAIYEAAKRMVGRGKDSAALAVEGSDSAVGRGKDSAAPVEGADSTGYADSCPLRQRILEKMVQGAELSGVALEGEKKARYNEISQELAKLSMDFANAVIDATKAYKFEKDGKTYTIDDANYVETMKNCADREVRENLYRARSARAPENEARIDRILALRRERAKLLGFDSPAELSLATKCAPSVAAVMKMIDELDAATAKIAAEEDAELAAEFRRGKDSAAPVEAVDSVVGRGKDSAAPVEGADEKSFPLQPWDFAYYSEKLRERKYSYSEEELKKYFELEDVLAGLFKMTKFLYGVDIVELKGADKPSVWHPDVRFFEVREAGAPIAHFYLDPYVRPGQKQGGAWMNEFRNRRAVRRGKDSAAPAVEGADSVVGRGKDSAAPVEEADSATSVELPLALLVLNNKQPEDGKCLMPMREVETLFHEFGHATQCMLTRIDEEDAAGISLVEWDAVEIASQFNEFWCLDDRTGITVPEDLKAKVKSAKNFRAASACRRQLAFAKTDLQLHLGEAESLPLQDKDVEKSSDSGGRDSSAPRTIKEENFRHFGLPFVEGDRFLCAFTHIFAGGYAAGYYGYKWAEVMCADCYGAFEEAGLKDDDAVKRVGQKYRDTILALGGSKSALEVFRQFRGRDPEIGAMLRQQGLVEK